MESKIDRLRLEIADWLKINLRNKQETNKQRAYEDKLIQKECCDRFNSYYNDVRDLDHRFEAFMRAIRPIGSSSGLISTSKELQQSMNEVLDSFRSNSADIWRGFSFGVGSNELPKNLRGSSDIDIETLSATLYDLSEKLRAFLEGLHGIPEFSDQRLSKALVELREWTRHRAERILSHKASKLVRKSTMRQYIDQVMTEMSPLVSNIGSALSNFADGGVTVILNAQEKAQFRFQNVSTVATFLSAVAATTMQYPMSGDSLSSVVMGLWISSLILSIASAINAQLVMHWRAAMYRSPRSALPIWMSVCLDHASIVCLVGAVLAFSAGLVVWTMAASLALAVKICAASMTAATFIVLLAIVGWEAGEWLYSKSEKVEKAPVETEPRAEMRVLHDLWQRWKNRKEGTPAKPLQGSVGYWQMLVGRITRYTDPGTDRSKSNLSHESQMLGNASSDKQGPIPDVSVGWAWASRNSSTPALAEWLDDYDHQDLELPRLPVIESVSPARGKFHKAVWKLMVSPRLRRKVLAQPLESPLLEHTSSKTGELQSLQPKQLQNLKPSHRLPVFHQTGHDIHFSPDRTRLAVSKLNGTVAIWTVGKFDEDAEMDIPCQIGRFIWSPDSSKLLIIAKKGLSLRDLKSSEAWDPLKTITKTIGPAAWLQSSPSFVVEIDRKLRIFDTHSRSEMKNHCELHRVPLRALDIASVPLAHPSGTALYGLVLVLGIVCHDEAPGSRASTFQKRRIKMPDSALTERWLILKDLDNGGRSVSEAPLLAEACHVCVNSSGQFALISYDDGNSPQLWRLRNEVGENRLVFRGRFTPHDSDEQPHEKTILRRAMFCGESDQCVMATDGRSNIYIWDRATRHLLHTLTGTQIQSKFQNYSNISTITCTVKHDCPTSLIVVSTGEKGGVIVWKEEEEQADRRSESGSSQAASAALV